jgi:hypothetical protein
LLRRAIAELTRHERELPPASDAALADYISCRDSLADTSKVLRYYDCDDRSTARWLTSSLFMAALEAPWEKARVEQLVDAVFAGRWRATQAGYPLVAAQRQVPGVRRGPGTQVLQGWLATSSGSEGERERERLRRLLEESWLSDILQPGGATPLLEAASHCRVRAHRLVVALALYRLEKGEPAPGLENLVAEHYLLEVPHDPFSPTVQRFSYRVSEGEVIDSGADPEPVQRVAAGQCVVWSVGPDLTDDGGHKQGSDRFASFPRLHGQGQDWIYLVPVLR